ncbi:MAG: hypothetical protein LLG06_17260 [Desulfobacteraceae bacterium]|nr:hypothetical protein [Desulfobacteraceae bacterium]
MTESQSPNYFLFPHMSLSESDARNIYLFLPQLYLLEIATRGTIPEWGGDKFVFWQAVSDEDALSTIRSNVRGYGKFAEIHGGGPGGSLAHLSQAMQEEMESRLEIQERLRRKRSEEGVGFPVETLRASVFLEMAMELDQKEIDLEASYTQLNALEGEFRGILGISPEEELEAQETGLISPLIPDRPGFLYMLSRRVESWFRLMSLQRIANPVFTALGPEVIDEVLERIRAGAYRKGIDFSCSRFSLGMCPRLKGLGEKQFRSLIEAPGTTDILLAYWRNLESFIEAAAGGESIEELQTRSVPLRSQLEIVCGICEVPDRGQTGLDLVICPNIPVSLLLEIFGAPGVSGLGNWPAIFLCTV